MARTQMQKISHPASLEPMALPVRADPLLTLIERVACDPSADIGKMRALLEMHQSLQQREAEKMFGAAMSAAQMEMEPIRASTENTQTRSKYASFAALDRVLRPIYTGHGFALSFNTAPCEHVDKLRLVCDVFHCGGHMRPYTLDMAADGKGAKGSDVMTKTHATGSALTYGQRYLMKMIFNISVERDDDGNKAAIQTGELLSAGQIAQLRALASDSGADLPKFFKWANVESFDDLLAVHFPKAKAAFEAKLRKVKA